MLISEKIIRTKLEALAIDFVPHAIFEAAADLIFVPEIETALGTAEIIEDQPDRGRCLLLGAVGKAERIHVVLDYADWLDDPDCPLVIVTVYRPDPKKWIDDRIRRT